VNAYERRLKLLSELRAALEPLETMAAERNTLTAEPVVAPSSADSTTSSPC